MQPCRSVPPGSRLVSGPKTYPTVAARRMCYRARYGQARKIEAARHSSARRPSLPAATFPLPWWSPGQYIEDFTSGNVGLAGWQVVFLHVLSALPDQCGIGIGGPLRWLYDKAQSLRGGVPYPRKAGKLR